MTESRRPDPPDTERTRRRRSAAAAAGIAVLVVVAGVVAVVLVTDDEASAPTGSPASTSAVSSSSVPVSPPPTSPTSSVTTTDDPTTSSTTSTTPPPTSTSTAVTTSTSTPTTTSTTIATDDLEAAVWPRPADGRRYTDPVVLATDFATIFVGFSDPEVGEFAAGDSRSGEVSVRARVGSSDDTIVLVRRLGPNDDWWVIGAANAGIVVDRPETGEVMTSPAPVSGEARAFEGTVEVTLWADGESSPIVETFVTGSGGPDLGPFASELVFDQPAATGGVLLFRSRSPEDDAVVGAAAVRVAFADS